MARAQHSSLTGDSSLHNRPCQTRPRTSECVRSTWCGDASSADLLIMALSRCSTRSLTQSILDYPTENGRRYHRYREGSYPFPNDDVELERLDLQYEMWKQAMGGRGFFAPLEDPKRMLDIGTGTGPHFRGGDGPCV